MDKTDATLKALEKQIKATYSKAYQEMKKEMADILAKIEVNPEMTLTQKMALMSKYDRLNTLSTQLANTAYNANMMAQKMISNEMVNIYELNYNESAERLGFGLVDHTAIKKILKQEENPFTMISSLRDKEGIRNEMKGQLLSGLLKGEGIPKIARRLKNVSEKSLKDSIRIARTETTRVQNSAKMDIGKEGQRLGFDMWKRWVATTDGRVREDHIAMDGIEVPQDEPFVLPDGSKMMFPGDISMGAPPEQTINCRCTMIEFAKTKENEEDYVDTYQDMSGMSILKADKSNVVYTRGEDFTRVEIKDGKVKVAVEFRDDKTIFVDEVYLEEKGKGIGLKWFENLVEKAQKEGYTKIELMAAGSRDSNNGYYTWARYGFDGELSFSVSRQATKEFGEPIKTIRDLFETQKGREWWKNNGSAMAMEFDLSKNSYSINAFERYMLERSKRK